jgi:hypothetical protein
MVPSDSLLAIHKAECERSSAEKAQLPLAGSRSGCARLFCAVAQALPQKLDGISEGGDEEEDDTGVCVRPLSALDRLAPRVGAQGCATLTVDDE